MKTEKKKKLEQEMAVAVNDSAENEFKNLSKEELESKKDTLSKKVSNLQAEYDAAKKDYYSAADSYAQCMEAAEMRDMNRAEETMDRVQKEIRIVTQKIETVENLLQSKMQTK